MKRRRDEEAEDGMQPMPQHKHVGIRGMSNLGQTCFMNSICQALCHNPLFRNYFLSECHTPNTCPIASRRRSAEAVCVACEFDALTQELYSGERTCFNPHRFLYIFWKQGMQSEGNNLYSTSTSCKLAGYEQHDAHEFLVALLDTLKAHDRSILTAPDEAGVVSHCFNGVLCSDVQCRHCHAVSSTKESFFDLSLEIDEAVSDHRHSTTGLLDCLGTFTKTEFLGADEKVHCSSCRVYQECTKHITIHKLPQVLCLHLKRFKHKHKQMRKIENYVSFPLEHLDMHPFISQGPKAQASEDGHKYDLFAVVEHHGNSSCQSGHYTAFIRHHWNSRAPPPSREQDADEYYRRRHPPKSDAQPMDDWYLFDDGCVYHATREEVSRCNAYMLFYVRKELSYERFSATS
mmetsp:Transcript_73024/g.128668  ORF Transcript_73024/g.128668 Transcript_73024/m.128668 type:complete len:403 (-) Transcript_73024:511-1719(-)